MDIDDIGLLNIDVLDEITGDLSACKSLIKQGLRMTSHLVKAVSVARAVGRCPFEARLIEIMGASDVVASTSLFPGKGVAVHQLLALAVPRLFKDYIAVREFGKALDAVDSYVKGALEELRDYKVPPLSDEAESARRDAVFNSAQIMARKFVELTRELDGRRLIDVTRARVRPELELYDYKLHVRGVVDLAIEEEGTEGRGVVVEWKTSLGVRGDRPSPDEVAQAYIYSIMLAHRLGYHNGINAVRKCKVFPVIIRDGGSINPYSVSKCYLTAKRAVDEDRLLRDIQLAATHLILYLLDLRKVDKSWDKDKEHSICGKDGKVAYRRVPGQLLSRGYSLNPHKNNEYPCGYCKLRDACKFYMFSRLEQDEVHRLAWKARYRVYGVRENALQPFRSIAVQHVSGFLNLEGGSRADLFDELKIGNWRETGELKAVLIRRLRREDEERGVPKTVREGKPVTLFFKDVEELIYSTNFSGSVERVRVSGDKVEVVVSFEGRFSKLAFFLLNDLLERENALARGVVAVEGNIDLTHIELMSIDAFQRATKLLAKEAGLSEDEAKKVAFRSGYLPKRRLYELFSIALRRYALR